MRLSFGQEMRQVQKQILAPRMIQSMEILQLPMLALQERVEQELQENEALELAAESEDLPEQDSEQNDIELPEGRSEDERELVVDETLNNADDFERLATLDDEWPDTFEERTKPSSQRIEEASDRQHDTMANMVSRPITLQDHLHDQLSYFDLSEEVSLYCDRIIYNLDKNGYLQGRLEDLLDPQQANKQLPIAKQALAIVQKTGSTGCRSTRSQRMLIAATAP